MYKKVAIIGRPNVGKSSLFNKITKRRISIVYQEAHTTRDTIHSKVSHNNSVFELIDTGGFDFDITLKDDISLSVKKRIKEAMAEADLVIFLCDVQDGITPLDSDIAEMLRKLDKKIIIAANKADNNKLQEDAVSFYELGFGKPYPVSALHGSGVTELLDEITKLLDFKDVEDSSTVKDIKIVVVGRPNAGKSSYVNSVLRLEKLIVSPTPGTTIDAVDSYFKYRDKNFILIDTAGLKHKRKLKQPVEVYSMLRAKEAIVRSDIAILIVDGTIGFVSDDKHILSYVYENKKPCVVLINKYDLMNKKEIEIDLVKKAEFLKFMGEEIPFLFVSCLSKQNIIKSLDLTISIFEKLNQKIQTSKLNKMLHLLESRGKIKLSYIVQASTNPQIFLLFVNNKRHISPDTENFVKNKIVKHFGLEGVPVTVVFKEKNKEREE